MGECVDVKDEMGSTMFHYAASPKSDVAAVEIFKKLMVSPPDNRRLGNDIGTPPLHIATGREFVDKNSLLIRIEASLTVTASRGRTAIHLAVDANHPEAAIIIDNLCRAENGEFADAIKIEKRETRR